MIRARSHNWGELNDKTLPAKLKPLIHCYRFYPQLAMLLVVSCLCARVEPHNNIYQKQLDVNMTLIQHIQSKHQLPQNVPMPNGSPAVVTSALDLDQASFSAR